MGADWEKGATRGRPKSFVGPNMTADAFLANQAFDAKAIARRHGRCDVIGHRRRSFALTQQRQQEIVIAEDGQRSFVDDRNVGEFEMGLERLMRHDGGFDHRGEAHRGIDGPGFESRPFGGA